MVCDSWIGLYVIKWQPFWDKFVAIVDNSDLPEIAAPGPLVLVYSSSKGRMYKNGPTGGAISTNRKVAPQ